MFTSLLRLSTNHSAVIPQAIFTIARIIPSRVKASTMFSNGRKLMRHHMSTRILETFTMNMAKNISWLTSPSAGLISRTRLSPTKRTMRSMKRSLATLLLISCTLATLDTRSNLISHNTMSTPLMAMKSMLTMTHTSRHTIPLIAALIMLLMTSTMSSLCTSTSTLSLRLSTILIHTITHTPCRSSMSMLMTCTVSMLMTCTVSMLMTCTVSSFTI